MNFANLTFPAVLFASYAIVADIACASPIYRWRDAQGVTHYSSVAPSKDAKPADLPKIMRGDPKFASNKLVSCEQHGGVNCPAGADADGSVICLDGFKNATLRFRFSCSVPKLTVNDITDVAKDGSFSVMVRNTKSVDAKGVAVAYKAQADKKLALEGPSEIGAFGAAEYKYHSNATSSDVSTEGLKLAASNVEIACANCP